MDDSKLKACDDRIDGPHGFIQWKGTHVCMDVYCACGHHGHIDGYFFYFYECQCGLMYEVGVFIKLFPVTDPDILEELKTESCVQRETP
jgi:hypothetical protein